MTSELNHSIISTQIYFHQASQPEECIEQISQVSASMTIPIETLPTPRRQAGSCCPGCCLFTTCRDWCSDRIYRLVITLNASSAPCCSRAWYLTVEKKIDDWWLYTVTLPWNDGLVTYHLSARGSEQAFEDVTVLVCTLRARSILRWQIKYIKMYVYPIWIAFQISPPIMPMYIICRVSGSECSEDYISRPPLFLKTLSVQYP